MGPDGPTYWNVMVNRGQLRPDQAIPNMDGKTEEKYLWFYSYFFTNCFLHNEDQNVAQTLRKICSNSEQNCTFFSILSHHSTLAKDACSLHECTQSIPLYYKCQQFFNNHLTKKKLFLRPSDRKYYRCMCTKIDCTLCTNTWGPSELVNCEQLVRHLRQHRN